MNDTDELTVDELIDDVVTRGFIMMLGIKMPHQGVTDHLSSWIKIKARKQQEAITEDFILNQITTYIEYLFER